MRLLPLLITSLAFVVVGCSRPNAPAPASTQTPIKVRTTRLETVNLPLTQALPATVHPLESATLAARVMGSVNGADFAVGQSVKAGELLLSLNAAELPARLAQARAALAQAEREASREAALVRQNATAADNALAAEDHRRIAAAAVNEAEALLSYTRVVAPFSGTITKKFVNSGDFAAPGTPLLAIEARDRLRAEVQVPATLAAPAAGSVLPVQLDPASDPLNAELVEFSAAADPLTQTRLAKLELPKNSAVRSGQFVRVLWPIGTAPTLLIPTSAVQHFGQMERVFVVTSESRAQLRLVKTATHSTALSRILAGLTAGEIVILNPAATLRDGQSVIVSP